MAIQQQNILWGYWVWTSNCKPCDSLDADKDGDELLDGVELQVVVDQAHPVAMVRGAGLGMRVTIYIVDAAEVDDDCEMALWTSIVLILLMLVMMVLMMKAM